MNGFARIFKRPTKDCLHTEDGENAELHNLIQKGVDDQSLRKDSWQDAKDAGATPDMLALLED